MITYGFSIQGKSHIKKDIVCQDANKVGKIKAGYYIGIIADGVGSAPHSDIGSKMAVDTLFEYCNIHIKKGQKLSEVQKVLEAGYTYAFSQIEEYAYNYEDNIEDYDTTLSAVLYKGKKAVFGHAGDGGIIVKYSNGIIKPITTRQKGADGTSVMPLRAGATSWKFGTCDNVSAVMLLTDGMLDGVVQHILVNLPPNLTAMEKGDFNKDNVYITAAEFFMNPYSVYQNRNIDNPEQFMKNFLKGNLIKTDQDKFLECIESAYTNMLGEDDGKKAGESIKKYYYAVWAMKNVTDDKTVVCIIDDKEKMKAQDIRYYIEPDWNERQKKYNTLLYGGIDNEKREISQDINDEDKKSSSESTVIIDTPDKPYIPSGKKGLKRKRLIKVSVILGGVIITLLVGFALGAFVGHKTGSDSEVVEKNTKQKETTGIFNNSKVNTQVESFMDNIKKLDNDISEEMKTEFKKAVQKYGFADIITIIRNYKQTDHSSENIVMVGNTERESVLSSNKESVKKETHIYETSQKASEKITSKHEELNTIDTLINIMNEVSNENTIESFQQKTESYLEKCNDISVTQIKEKINLLYPKYGSDLVY